MFNEIYGCYYNAVAKILALAVDGTLTKSKIREITEEYAFEESRFYIYQALTKQKWMLLTDELGTPLNNAPHMPITLLEKRWLKTILGDPRVALFGVDQGDLENVEPLFHLEDIVYFDRYSDRDHYEDPEYIINFGVLRDSIKNKKKVSITFINGQSVEETRIVCPIKLEYSDRDDKFRALCRDDANPCTINLGRIVECRMLEESYPHDLCLLERERKRLVFELKDKDMALENVMNKFSYFERRAIQLDERTYRIELLYDAFEEIDILIQLLSLGKNIKVISPDEMIDKIKERIKKQMELL